MHAHRNTQQTQTADQQCLLYDEIPISNGDIEVCRLVIVRSVDKYAENIRNVLYNDDFEKAPIRFLMEPKTDNRLGFLLPLLQAGRCV